MGRAGAGRRRAAPSGRSGNFTAGAGRKGTEAIPSAEYRAVFCHAASYGDDDPYDEKNGLWRTILSDVLHDEHYQCRNDAADGRL